MNPKARLKNRIAKLSDDQLLDAIMSIVTRRENPEVLVVRVNLFHEYENRWGGEAVDALMDALGR